MTLSNPFVYDPRVYNEAESLVKAGHKVTVFAWDKKKEYKKKEIKDEIKVFRSYNNKFMDLLPYDILRLHLWWIKGFRDAEKLNKKNSFDVIHCHNFDTLPICVKLKKKYEIPIVYDAHEIWGYMIKRDLPNIWAKYYLYKEKKLIKNVDQIITVNEPLKNYFKKITEKPIDIIMNCKKLETKEYVSSKNKDMMLVYIGTLSKSRFLIEIVEVVKDIKDVRCIIGGIGAKKNYVNKLKNKCSKAKNIEFIGRVPMDKVLSITRQSDVVICMTDPEDANNSIALANKQFEAMVTGRPIITTKGTYPGFFTKKEKCGIIVEYNKQNLKNAIIKLKQESELREKLGRQALKRAVEEYNWEKQGKKMIKVYRDLELKKII